jgi:hypothetical protein
MRRTVAPGVFVSQNILTCDPNHGFVQVRYHERRQDGQVMRLSSCYGMVSILSQVPRLEKGGDSLSSVTVKYPLRHLLLIRIVSLSKPVLQPM